MKKTNLEQWQCIDNAVTWFLLNIMWSSYVQSAFSCYKKLLFNQHEKKFILNFSIILNLQCTHSAVRCCWMLLDATECCEVWLWHIWECTARCSPQQCVQPTLTGYLGSYDLCSTMSKRRCSMLRTFLFRCSLQIDCFIFGVELVYKAGTGIKRVPSVQSLK